MHFGYPSLDEKNVANAKVGNKQQLMVLAPQDKDALLILRMQLCPVLSTTKHNHDFAIKPYTKHLKIPGTVHLDLKTY